MWCILVSGSKVRAWLLAGASQWGKNYLDSPPIAMPPADSQARTLLPQTKMHHTTASLRTPGQKNAAAD